ncbi:MAG TPA: hypothetical protein VFP72_16095, partial [Kineosporiaceae bacterium]|nr:hypothetical protein [Kineosporiaceae bacterium]
IPVAGPPDGVPGPAGPQAPDAAGAERGAWRPPSRGVGPVRPTGTLLATGLALVAVTAVAPGGALVLAAVLMVVARTVDRTATALWRRRQDAGHRAGDVAVAVVALPWRLVQAAVSTLFALVLPLLVGASVAFIASAGAADGLGMRTGRIPGTPTSPWALAAGALATLLMAWWGPGGGALRRGGRAMARSALRYSWTRLALWALLALVVVSALIVVLQNPQPVAWLGRQR